MLVGRAPPRAGSGDEGAYRVVICGDATVKTSRLTTLDWVLIDTSHPYYYLPIAILPQTYMVYLQQLPIHGLYHVVSHYPLILKLYHHHPRSILSGRI